MEICSYESQSVLVFGPVSNVFFGYPRGSLGLGDVQPGPSVVFMLKHLKLQGCEVPPSNIICAPCDYTRSGGFSPEAGAVILCAGKFFSKNHMENTLVHELVHMYDHSKFKVDWNNLRHHACSEVGEISSQYIVLSYN